MERRLLRIGCIGLLLVSFGAYLYFYNALRHGELSSLLQKYIDRMEATGTLVGTDQQIGQIVSHIQKGEDLHIFKARVAGTAGEAEVVLRARQSEGGEPFEVDAVRIFTEEHCFVLIEDDERPCTEKRLKRVNRSEVRDLLLW